MLKEPSQCQMENKEGQLGEINDEESAFSGEGEPRYVTRKGNCTHLQLDLSKAGAGGGDMPVFSLLDEDSLLGSGTDEERSRANSPTRSSFDSQPKQSLLDTAKTRQPTSPPNEPEFKPWGFDDNEDKQEPQPKKGPLGFSLSPKGNKSSLSPTGIRRAVKAFKYTKPTMSGATDLADKLSKGFRQQMGFAPQHQQMDDGDDLEELL